MGAFDVRLACGVCAGRGWVPGKREWAERCPACGGRARISFYALGKRMSEHPSTLRSVYGCRAKSETGVRVLRKLVGMGVQP